jgi:hypothetical protein
LRSSGAFGSIRDLAPQGLLADLTRFLAARV